MNVKFDIEEQNPVMCNSDDTITTEKTSDSINDGNKSQHLQPKEILGRRLLSVTSLNSMIRKVSEHSMICSQGPVSFIDEKRSGLEAELLYLCGCGLTFSTKTSSTDTTLAANEGLVWGCQVAATGYTAASTILTTLDIPKPTYQTFRRQQDILQDQILEAMKLDMKKWAMKEMELAIQAGDFVIVGGIHHPAILVILDGAWSKRSYGHSYSSNCGIAVIIGARTGKVIYADVKIRTCSTCDRKRSGEIPPHDCSKNWTAPPTAMESAIIFEGFSSSISEYGLVYNRFVGDGDSSVHPGLEVTKIKCKNHVVKNFTARLMDIAHNRVKGPEAPRIYADERRVINPKLHRFRVALRQAIRYNSENGQDYSNLRHDILNIPNHVFGDHANCRGYYQCNLKDVNTIPTISKMNFWGPSSRALERVASFASSLIHNETSNKAESFMSIACKYVEGKRKNFGQRGLYKIRMAGAVFSYNESLFWANEAYKLIKREDISSPLWAKNEAVAVKRRSLKAKYRIRRPLVFPQLSDRRGDLDYGSHPATPDIDDESLAFQVTNLRKRLQLTEIEACKVEVDTRRQADNPDWFRQRHGRITASFAPTVFKLKDTTSNKAALDQYFNRKRTMKCVQEAMQHGKDNEHRAIEAYETHFNLEPGTVKPSGLYVYLRDGIFAASPDGIVGNDGIVEVKCPYSLYTKADGGPPLHPNTFSSLTKCKEGCLRLNRSHEHYRQIVTQIHVTGRQWCDYVVWSESGIYVERIERSIETEKLWDRMRLKLTRFWEHELAPEILDSRYDRKMEYRYPSWRQKLV